MAALAREEGEEEVRGVGLCGSRFVSVCVCTTAAALCAWGGSAVGRLGALQHTHYPPIPIKVLRECGERMAELEGEAEALRTQTLLVDGPGAFVMDNGIVDYHYDDRSPPGANPSNHHHHSGRRGRLSGDSGRGGGPGEWGLGGDAAGDVPALGGGEGV